MRGERYLTRPEQYALVYDKGSSRVGDLLVIKTLPNGTVQSSHVGKAFELKDYLQRIDKATDKFSKKG